MSEELSSALSEALSSGFQVDPDAFESLSHLPSDMDARTVVRTTIQRKKEGRDRVIRKVDVESLLPSTAIHPPVPLEVAETGEIEVISDPTKEIGPSEAEAGFKKLFQDRYWRLLGIARRRPDSKDVSTIEGARASREKSVKIAGLISAKSSKRGGGVELVIDDPTGSARIQCGEELSQVALRAPLDTLLIAEVSGGPKRQFYAKSLTAPDVPDRRPAVTSHRAYAVLISDLHVGSEMFLVSEFERMILWLNGGLGELDIVNRVKYLVIAGDVIDGVGVYPGQEYQLLEKDLKRQYDLAGRLIERVPKRIKILISPGNHDPVRQALPQPAIPAEVAESLYKLDNVIHVGNPASLKLNGVTFLVYHGRSLDDVIATVPDLSYDKPAAAMQVLLKSRHLAPMYGKRTALSPESRDMLVIDPVPDVFHCGHVHTIDISRYRGTLLVNSGTFQSQTPFQANMGLEPVCSIVPIVDLSTLEVEKRSFTKRGFGFS